MPRRAVEPLLRAGIVALVLAGSPLGASQPADLLRDLRALQADDARLQTIGYRLVTANAPLCADQQPSLGLLLADMRNFTQPAQIRAALDIRGDFAVEAVADGSPAADAGLLAGAEVIAIDGLRLETLPAAAANDNKRLPAVHDRIDAALRERGRIRLTLPFGTLVEIKGVSACRSRFELVTRGQGASADGRLAQVSRSLLSRAQSDDEAAFVAAHEMAHNLLHHRDRLMADGRSPATARATEREADRLAPWLMANAGYDPSAGATFLRRWGARGIAALLQEPTHDRPTDRAKAVEAELAAIRAMAPGPERLRDWRGRFAPFTAPAPAAMPRP